MKIFHELLQNIYLNLAFDAVKTENMGYLKENIQPVKKIATEKSWYPGNLRGEIYDFVEKFKPPNFSTKSFFIINNEKINVR